MLYVALGLFLVFWIVSAYLIIKDLQRGMFGCWQYCVVAGALAPLFAVMIFPAMFIEWLDKKTNPSLVRERAYYDRIFEGTMTVLGGIVLAGALMTLEVSSMKAAQADHNSCQCSQEKTK